MSRIGVEESLTNIQEALREKGFDVVEIKQEADAKNLDCCVVTGMESNVMGISDPSIKASIIDANGLTADEVCNKVEDKLNAIQ
ncbi:YkuS family protein [Peribacillus muralis]|uniref:YkuS family protein n=1 Tax=Peribacillus muralis TaxID=264697 RepID=UPI001F4DFD89|nr:YkuS family protein [Peribacillus muralis]MCK1991004.1 YkuS family protein [Peribacillus muralis]MCK2011558.1 YkuS family protein [Peribacillus muralis]